MTQAVTDDDIRTFLKKNGHVYPSQIELMQAAVQNLWPGGVSEERSKRLVRLCLEEFCVPSDDVWGKPPTGPLPALSHPLE